MVILENIDIDIDIDKAILQNIDIDKISNRFKFGISNRANGRSTSFASRLGVILTIKARLTKCFNHCWLIPGLSNDFLHNHK